MNCRTPKMRYRQVTPERNWRMVSYTKTQDVKSAVRQLADTLPDDATWDDVMYRVYVHQAVDAGLRDSAEGRLVDVAEVRRQFGLAE
jgi:hypothetical protein